MIEQKNITGQQQDYMIGRKLFSWEAPEYFQHQRGNDWYWWVGLAAVILLGISLWQGSFLFGILILVGWFTVILYAIRPPRTFIFTITEKGILVKNPHAEGVKMYPWQELKSFWIFYKPPIQEELSVVSKKTMMPYIKMPLGGADPAQIENIVAKYIPKEEQKESLIDSLAHFAKF